MFRSIPDISVFQGGAIVRIEQGEGPVGIIFIHADMMDDVIKKLKTANRKAKKYWVDGKSRWHLHGPVDKNDPQYSYSNYKKSKA